MIEVLFVNFAVFNVADSFITVGVFALVIYVLFFDQSDKNTSK
jgi:lipoprotein signal peptidase